MTKAGACEAELSWGHSQGPFLFAPPSQGKKGKEFNGNLVSIVEARNKYYTSTKEG